jgi:hypothetical protein
MEALLVRLVPLRFVHLGCGELALCFFVDGGKGVGRLASRHDECDHDERHYDYGEDEPGDHAAEHTLASAR